MQNSADVLQGVAVAPVAEPHIFLKAWWGTVAIKDRHRSKLAIEDLPRLRRYAGEPFLLMRAIGHPFCKED